MVDNKSGADALNQLKDLAMSVDICMFTTLHNGRMYARPMSTQEVEEDGTMWFFSYEESQGAQDANYDHVSLSYADKVKSTYLTVQGRAEISHDKVKMKELWKDILKAWFPQGLDTPGLILIRVTPEEAHYWDSDASRMRILAQYAYAKVTGNYKSMEGKEGELELPNAAGNMEKERGY